MFGIVSLGTSVVSWVRSLLNRRPHFHSTA